jgi:hypothetical protein
MNGFLPFLFWHDITKRCIGRHQTSRVISSRSPTLLGIAKIIHQPSKMNMTLSRSSSTPPESLATPNFSSFQIRNPPSHDAAVSNGQPRQAKPNDPHTEPKDVYKASVEETLDERIERLGRERPPGIKSLWHEIGLVFSVAMSQFLTEFFVSGFVVILPTLIKELEIPRSSSVWPATAFSLVIASTLLTFGRLGDMWGAYPVFMIGMVWFVVWSVICGFSINPLMLDFCRALQGLGAAAFLPTGVQLLGPLYRPGPRKNLVFAIYGTSAIFGFFAGIFVAHRGSVPPMGYLLLDRRCPHRHNTRDIVHIHPKTAGGEECDKDGLLGSHHHHGRARTHRLRHHPISARISRLARTIYHHLPHSGQPVPTGRHQD